MGKAEEFESFLEKYNEFKLAYLDGDLRLKNVIIEEPYGYRVHSQVEIKNKVIREWWKETSVVEEIPR